MKYSPHNYQTYATDFILEHPVSAVFLDMGLGKSVITLTAIFAVSYTHLQQGVQVLPHQPLALIGLHGFPLLIFGQRVHFGREVELLTLPHIHEGFRPDL